MGLFVGDAGENLGPCWVVVGLGLGLLVVVGVGGRGSVRLGCGLCFGLVRLKGSVGVELGWG